MDSLIFDCSKRTRPIKAKVTRKGAHLYVHPKLCQARNSCILAKFMNYRHAYHAGNFADVLKHALLCWIVRYLQQKEAPLCLIDTHAGAGLYDLTGTQAEKTGEAKDGIQRLLGHNDVPTPFAPYLDLVRKANPSYPGSPALLSALARPHDKIILCELHPEEASQLRQSLPPNKHTRIITGDGYRTLPTLIPPPEKRGLVLIDPPFEQPEELETLTRSFAAICGV